MKNIIFALLLSLTTTLKAETTYFDSMNSVYGKMLEAKKNKDTSIRSSKPLSEIARAAAIQRAMSEYKDKMMMLQNEEANIRERFYGKVTSAEEAQVIAESDKTRKVIHDESALEEAAGEINLLP